MSELSTEKNSSDVTSIVTTETKLDKVENDLTSKESITSTTDIDIVNTTKPIVVEADDGFALHGIPFSLTMFSLCLACFMAGLG